MRHIDILYLRNIAVKNVLKSKNSVYCHKTFCSYLPNTRVIVPRLDNSPSHPPSKKTKIQTHFNAFSNYFYLRGKTVENPRDKSDIG